LQQESHTLPYKAVIVEEAHAMVTGAFYLIRHIVPPGKNDLFMVEDPLRRIHNLQHTLKYSGISTRKNIYTLRTHYRTTEEIRNWAVTLLTDGTEEVLHTRRGNKKLIQGSPPKVQHFSDFKDEVRAIVEHIHKLCSKENRHQICLVVRTERARDRYNGALAVHSMETYIIHDAEPEDVSRPGIRICTMERIGGLEFDHVILAGVNDGLVPFREAIMAAADPQHAEKRERILLYVAATRAKKSVLVTSSGTRSPFLLTETPFPTKKVSGSRKEHKRSS